MGALSDIRTILEITPSACNLPKRRLTRINVEFKSTPQEETESLEDYVSDRENNVVNEVSARNR